METKDLRWRLDMDQYVTIKRSQFETLVALAEDPMAAIAVEKSSCNVEVKTSERMVGYMRKDIEITESRCSKSIKIMKGWMLFVTLVNGCIFTSLLISQDTNIWEVMKCM